MYGRSSGSGMESSMEESEGGYSHKRMFVGICGVLPAIAWTAVLVLLYLKNEDNECMSPRRLEERSSAVDLDGLEPVELWSAPTAAPPSWMNTGYAYPSAATASPAAVAFNAAVATAPPAFATFPPVVTPSPPFAPSGPHNLRAAQPAPGGHVKRFMQFSIAGFVLLVLIEIVEGCVAGEHDFKVTSQECCINLATLVVFIGIYIVNYYGVVQLYTATGYYGGDCQGTLIRDGWLVLLGNNLVWFLTVATMIATAFCGQAIAGADWLSGDRL